MPFTKLGLSDKVLAAAKSAGYTTPTPIQEQAIPHVLARRDVLGIAQTGTGKTAAFVLPMLTMLEQGRARARMPRTLILEPTRELAAQVEDSFDKYGKNHKLNVALIIGGVSFDDQDNKLMRGVDVLIATPGRLLDHFERGRLLMSGVELLVIDEADRMLDMGFIPDIERICKLVPFTRQTLFFTATMPPEIRRITEQFLHNPVKVEVAKPATTVAAILQQLVKTGREPHDKRDTLRRAIRAADSFKNAIIFCNRKREVAQLHRSLVRHGFNAVALHGDMDQSARTAALDAFRNGETETADRLRRRRPRARHPGRQSRLQLRRPPSRRRLRAPHRPHRPRRQDRHGVYHRRPGDGKAVSEIEKLIGQSITWAEACRANRLKPRRGPGGTALRPREPRREVAAAGGWPPQAARTARRPSRSTARTTSRSPEELRRYARSQPTRAGANRASASARPASPASKKPGTGRRRPGRASRPNRAAAIICRPFCFVRCAPGPKFRTSPLGFNRPFTCPGIRRGTAFFTATMIWSAAQFARFGPGTRNVGARRRARTHAGIRRDCVRTDQGSASASDPAQLRGLVRLRDRLQPFAESDDQRNAAEERQADRCRSRTRLYHLSFVDPPHRQARQGRHRG